MILSESSFCGGYHSKCVQGQRFYGKLHVGSLPIMLCDNRQNIFSENEKEKVKVIRQPLV